MVSLKSQDMVKIYPNTHTHFLKPRLAFPKTSAILADPGSHRRFQVIPADSVSSNQFDFLTSSVAKISLEAHQRAGRGAIIHGSFSPEMMERMKQSGNDCLGSYLNRLVYAECHELIDIRESVTGTGPVRYARTGEPVTQESSRYFKTVASNYQSQKIKLYEEELQKGADLGEIYEKLADLTARQPRRFLDMLGYTAINR